MFVIQRSIPIPRIKIERILNYIDYVGSRGEVTTEELKNRNLDFGRDKFAHCQHCR